MGQDIRHGQVQAWSSTLIRVVFVATLASCGIAGETPPPVHAAGDARLTESQDSTNGDGAECEPFEAYARLGILDALSEAVAPAAQGELGSVVIPGGVTVTKGFGVDLVLIDACVSMGHPSNPPGACGTSTNPWSPDGWPDMGVRVGGLRHATAPDPYQVARYEAARRIFEAMTGVGESVAGSTTIRSTRDGRVRCERTVYGNGDVSTDCYFQGIVGAIAHATGQRFDAEFGMGLVDSLAAVVDPAMLSGPGAVTIPGGVKLERGFGVDIALLETTVFVGHPWSAPGACGEEQADPWSLAQWPEVGVMVGGFLDAVNPDPSQAARHEVARRIHEAMTRATEKVEGPTTIRSTRDERVRCERWVNPDGSGGEQIDCFFRGMIGANTSP
ncbi:MAG: hypothetical protein AB2A00_41140 [Myxococcota bacterium]